jgi:hypothetical protein
MTNFQRPDDWTDEKYDAYFGSADDPIKVEPVSENPEILDLYAFYDPAAIEAAGDEGTLA